MWRPCFYMRHEQRVRLLMAEDEDWRELDALKLSERIMTELEEMIADFEASTQKTDKLLSEIRKGSIPLAYTEETPLPLARAVCLPELGGSLALNSEWDAAGPTLTVDKLREAIKRGKLADSPLDEKNRYTTLKNIKEWLNGWRDDENHQGSNSRPNERTGTVASKKPSGSSSILTREKDAKLSSARDSALMKAQMLRNTLRNGS